MKGMGIALAGALLFGCAAQGQGPEAGSEPPQSSDISAVSNTMGLPASDNQAKITLSQSGGSVEGQGASVSGGKVTISKAGEYLITGTTKGQIYVEAGKGDTVVLRLSGAEVINDTDAAIYVEKAGSTVLWLEEGTENLLQSGTAPADGVLSAEADEEAGGGALYARDDLTLAGDGSLRVLGYLNNGVQTSNNLTISGGSITVEAVNNGVKGKDSVTVTGGTLDIRSGGDGIKSDDDTGEGYGTVAVSGGEITIRATGDGIQAETTLDITGGTFDIVTGGGSDKAVSSGTGGWGRGMGGMNFPGSFDNENWDMEDEGSVSAKGLKSGTAATITGGVITADCLDDAVHSNGDITITGGEFTLATGDDGVHADNTLTIRDGMLTVTKSYEGLEANIITIAGGQLDITARDDGINAYGGQNRMGGGRFGESGKTTDTMPELTISGGNILVSAEGDGLDSNGNLTVTGGVTVINGPESSGNGALDVGAENGGKAIVTGGVVLAIGASGMDESFDGSSAQCSFRVGSSFSAGDEIVILDPDGTELFRHTAAKRGSSVVFTSPDLVLGSTYTVKTGSQSAEVTLDSVSTGDRGGFGGFGGGRMNGSGGQRPDRGDFDRGGFNGRQPDGTQPPELPDGMQPPDGTQGRGPGGGRQNMTQ